MNAARHLENEIGEHLVVLERTRESVLQEFGRIADVCVASLRAGHKVVFFGNGGSAADAQHFATELVVRYRINRPAIRAVALTTDTSALTAIGNDYGFDDVFARQVEALCQAGDVVIGISTSGNSENIIRGLRAARTVGAVTVGLGGGTGGRMLEHADHAVIVPSQITARIQEIHLIIGHTLCDVVERELTGNASE